MSSMNKKIMLQSSDGKPFEVDEAVAVQCQTIRHMIEDDCANTVIPVPNVTGDILAKVLAYCEKHAGPVSEDDDSVKSWDAEFVKLDNELDTLYDLILAANYLDIKSLLDLTCKKVADLLKGLTPEQMRKKFNIKNDLTPEEVEQVHKENSWAFNY